MRHYMTTLLLGTIAFTALALPEPEAHSEQSNTNNMLDQQALARDASFAPSPFDKINAYQASTVLKSPHPETAIAVTADGYASYLNNEEQIKKEAAFGTEPSTPINKTTEESAAKSEFAYNNANKTANDANLDPIDNGEPLNGTSFKESAPTTSDVKAPDPNANNNGASYNNSTTFLYGPPAPSYHLVSTDLKKDQTLAQLLKRAGVDNRDSYLAVKALSEYVDPRKIRVGETIRLTFDKEGEGAHLLGLSLKSNFDTIAYSNRDDDGNFKASEQKVGTITNTLTRSGTIDSSLFISARDAKVPSDILINMIRLFSYDVDFQREIRKGDGFRVLFERRTRLDNGEHEDGRILFAELTLQGQPLGFYYYKPQTQTSARYFDRNGKSAQKALMKTPVDGARISGTFGKRKHPILGYTKNHYGVDFAAPRGTPIMAAGDGVIERASRWGTFGNYIRIRHPNGYKTAYAHLNGYGRGIRKGKRVEQGDIIGYVGTTGRSTGPHLHYEVYNNGKRVNPLRLKFPTGYQLPETELANLRVIADRYDDLFSQTLLAKK